MNKSLINKKKGVRMLISLTLSLVMIFTAGASVFAMEDGDTISYRGNLEDHCSHQFWSADGEYYGTCCQIGNPADDKDKATVYEIENTEKIAKIAYYIYKHDWLSNRTSVFGDYASNYHYAGLATNSIQITQQGKAEWKRLAMSHDGYDDTFCERILAKYDDYFGGDLETPPANFEVWYCVPVDKSQEFILWREAPNGYITVNKTPTWKPYNNDDASLRGAVYNVYKNSACTKRAKDANGDDFQLTTKANGTANVVEIALGTYYVKEVTASPGFELDPTVHKVKVTTDNDADNPAEASSDETPTTGWAKAKKESANPDITG